MPHNAGLPIVFGAASVGVHFRKAALSTLLKTLKEGGIGTLDTAQQYGESEQLLGEVKASEHFVIDTKAFGGIRPGSNKNLVENAKESLKKLQMKQVDVFYLHAPDDSYPLEDTIAKINEVYKLGLFKRFGLSNFKSEDVRKACDICTEKGYVIPTVYQGNYSPAARKQETLLFPTLRELGIAFYCYSPIAGGFLAKDKNEVLAGAGRFDPSTARGQMYSDMYARGTLLDSLAHWEQIAKDEGCSKSDLAYRWVRFNSSLKKEHGDKMIVGARTLEQLQQTLAGADQPLSSKAARAVDEFWEKIKDEAPLDNIHR